MAVNLPGALGIRTFTNQIADTQSDTQTSDGNSFSDGSADEYAFSDPDENGNEYYHYLLLYETADANSTPLVFPINKDERTFDNTSRNNVTLTVSKILSSEDNDELNTDGTKIKALESLEKFRSYLAGVKPYVLMNFRLEPETTYSLSDGTQVTVGENETTPSVLMRLKHGQLEKLQLRDYKVKGQSTIRKGEEEQTVKADFFTMSNSTYYGTGGRIIDGSIDTNKVFSTESEAKAQPGMLVYVDRLASKVTVTFDIASMETAGKNNFGVRDEAKLISVLYDEAANSSTYGLPILNVKVGKVNMREPEKYENGIKFDDSGYSIQTDQVDAEIKILGFALDNVEPYTKLFKDFTRSYSTDNWKWNDTENHRSYWGEDGHFMFERALGNKAGAAGYPHQYRRALDHDSVDSMHKGSLYEGNNFTEYKLDDQTTGIIYHSLGVINKSDTMTPNLHYKSFNQLKKDFKLPTSPSYTESNGKKTYNYNPQYTLENTYYDRGMANRSGYYWNWYRAPYAAATNLTVLAQINIKNGEFVEGATEGMDLYLGQNNIFYLKKENFLKSKLTILNKVMLSGGNAGLQILKAQWDRHEPGENSDNLLDKIAWNEGSVLWFAKIETEKKDGKTIPKYEKVSLKDSDGNDLKDENGEIIYGYKVIVTSSEEVPATDEITNYFDLIPAEISGGDGQRLMAPHENYMGIDDRYYLAPKKADGTMDEEKAVEISYNHLVSLIHKVIGPVEVFKEGKMYYSIPIPHRNRRYDSTTLDYWQQFGAFALLRNNWYNITVTEITKLGTPVDDLDQPIIPVMDVKRSYINMGIKLKNWHVVEEDNIPMM